MKSLIIFINSILLCTACHKADAKLYSDPIGDPVVNENNTPAYNKLIKEFGAEPFFSAHVQQYVDNGFRDSVFVFTGSSTITSWETLESAFSKYDAINRGIGGSTLRQVISHSDNLIFKHNPKTVVLYIGDNDAYSYNVVTYKHYMDCFIANYLHRLPSSRLILVSVKPSPSREAKWDYYKNINNYLSGKAQEDKRVIYVDLWGAIMQNKKPEALFYDNLHMNATGYDILTRLLLEVL